MTSERDKCSLISSILPISCRDRAEAFARTLQSRLNHLGTHEDDEDDDDDDDVDQHDEKTWLAQHENSLSLSQPSRQTECYNNLELENCLFDESSPPCSPQEKIQNPIEKIFQKFDDKNGDVVTICNGLERNESSVDSENEIFYDLEEEENDNNDELLNNPSHIISDVKSLCLNDSCSSISADIFATSLDCTPQDTINEFSDTNGKIDENEDDDDEPTPRIRRCSSLKSGKTPPGTPGRKKIVRFADVLGLDLADVRTFLDEVPKVPKSAYNDLSDVDLSSSTVESSILHTNCVKNKPDRILLPLFEQPAGSVNFLDLVNDHKVCLENALVEDPILFLIKGTVRVRNLDFHKSVHLRYTLDNWTSFADVQAVYLNNSCDGFSDRFAFTIYAHTLQIGQKIQFACRFQCKGQQYWDNNNGKNYCFQCLPSNNSSSSSSTVLLNNEPSSSLADWSASFY